MDHIKNPFSPGAGSPPPELVGRDHILEKSRVLLGRAREGRSEKSLLLVGLRGVGKTVLLNEIERITRETGYHTIALEAHEDKSLAALLTPHLRQLLFELDRMKGLSSKVRRGLGFLRVLSVVLKSKFQRLNLGLI